MHVRCLLTKVGLDLRSKFVVSTSWEFGNRVALF